MHQNKAVFVIDETASGLSDASRAFPRSSALNIYGATSLTTSGSLSHGSSPGGGMSGDLSSPLQGHNSIHASSFRQPDPAPALGRMPMSMGQDLPSQSHSKPIYGGLRSGGSSLSATAEEFHLARISSPPPAPTSIDLGLDAYDFNAFSVGGNSPVIGGGNSGILGAYPGLGGPIRGLGLGHHDTLGSDYGGMGGSIVGGSSNGLSSIHSRGGSPVTNLSPPPPCGIKVTAETEALRAAGTLAFILSQWAMLPGISSIPHCALYLDGGLPIDQTKLVAAARRAIEASFLSHVALSSASPSGLLGSQSPPGQSRRPPSLSDLALVPLLLSDGSVSLLSVSVPPLPAAVWQSSAQQLLTGRGGGSVVIIEPGTNPLTKGHDAAMRMARGSREVGPAQAADVVFDGEEALVALQSVAVARINFLNSGSHTGDDLLILPIQAGGSEGDDSRSLGGRDDLSRRYHLRLVPASHVMSAGQMSELGLVIQEAQKVNEILLSTQGHGQGFQQQRGLGSHSIPSHPRLGGAGGETPKLVYSPYPELTTRPQGMDFPMMNNHQHGLISRGSSQINLNQNKENNQAQQYAPSMSMASTLPPNPPANQISRSQKQLNAQPMLGTVQRKADYVIVTEDTAVKNAAGAIAKVLSRVWGQGLSCPVFPERKTEHLTGVISVAVKAIAVARGYVENEEGGCQVAFQPYLRQAPSLQGLSFNSHHQVHSMLMGGVGELASTPHAFDRRSAPPAPYSDLLSIASGGLSPDTSYRAALIKSSENVDVDASFASSADEHSELAFDVFKVPPGLLPPEPDDGNLPVKVTAHSRASVVSNIITKLVVERGSVVLITAGGRAMHVAMLAVVSARARLRATLSSAGGGRGGGGVGDVLLTPKFVTVDTTSSLGWESVFLRFHIVAAPATLLGSELPQLQLQQQIDSQPSAVAIAQAAASARQQQQIALMGAQLNNINMYGDRSMGGSPPPGPSLPSLGQPASPLDAELLIRMMTLMNNQQLQ